MKKQSILKAMGLFFILLLLANHSSLAAESIHVNFESGEIGKFPSGWASNDKKTALKIYTIQSEGDKKFLHADAKDSWAQIGLEKRWALKEFPILQWQWRAILFPTNSNEREKSRNDSVLGVYVVFGHWPFITTKPKPTTFDYFIQYCQTIFLP